jgi:hypothetical protein
LKVEDKEIVFVTTSLNTKWLEYQSFLIGKFFPESSHLVVDGSKKWPNSWFYWIDLLKSRKERWYIHIDEDFFIEDPEQVRCLISKMEEEGYDLSGISEAFCHFRGNNPVALNSLFMVGRVSDLQKFDININEVFFFVGQNGWSNSLNIKFEDSFLSDFKYPHEKSIDKSWHQKEAEPYYLFMWIMKSRGLKFYYLYPEFDLRFKSTNPRIYRDSPDIGIHMWYTRIWNDPMDVHGTPNNVRYELLENYLRNKYFARDVE